MSENTQKAEAKNKPVKKKVKKNVSVGRCYIFAGFGNTIVTITDTGGNTVSWSTGGMLGFKGSRKGTPYAAQLTAEDACKKALEHGLKSVDVFVSGPGAGRETAIRAVGAAGIRVSTIKDVTGVPHNGCRPPKRRRV
ncbi:MAG: 30S ribosomal protein S11 [Bdellovibrionota bacterium]